MISWRRIVLESVLFAAIVCGGYILFEIIQGMIITQAYVPDILSQYEHVEHLPSQVSFGAVLRGGKLITVQGAALFLVLCGLYGSIRYAFTKRKR